MRSTVHKHQAGRALILTCTTLVIATLAHGDSEIPESLRGGIDVDRSVVRLALAMQYQGWDYVMPRPKSDSASWGNDDPRTTWYYGYWINRVSDTTSISTPQLNNEGDYVGDHRAKPGAWRRGGSPKPPNPLQWLLSKSGGVKPNTTATARAG